MPLIIRYLSMVDAAGVEPASEIHVGRETPCIVEFSEPTRCDLFTSIGAR